MMRLPSTTTRVRFRPRWSFFWWKWKTKTLVCRNFIASWPKLFHNHPLRRRVMALNWIWTWKEIPIYVALWCSFTTSQVARKPAFLVTGIVQSDYKKYCCIGDKSTILRVRVVATRPLSVSCNSNQLLALLVAGILAVAATHFSEFLSSLNIL